MRQLHVLGVSDDGEALLLGPSAGKNASHRLRLDDKLRAAVRGQLTAAGVERAESALSPKEMQARLREGATPEEVAKEAQVPVARVLPYAAPVIAERERIVEQARAAMLHRSRGPNGSRPLGELVDAHLGDTAGFKPDSVEWTASRRRDGAWVVQLSYAARGGRRTASWLWRMVERDLTALDASATRLASEEPTTATRRRAAAPKRAAAPRAGKRAAGTRATKKAARRPAVKKKAAQKKSTQKKTAQKSVVRASRTARPVAKPATKAAATRRSAAKKPVVKKAVAKRAASRPAAAKKAVPAKAVPAKAAPKKAAAKKAAPKKPAPVPRAVKAARQAPEEAAIPVRPTVVPDPVINEPGPPIVVIRPQVQPEPEPVPEPEPIVARRPGQRVPLPSWSDVLIGVVPPEPSRQDAAARRRRKSG